MPPRKFLETHEVKTGKKKKKEPIKLCKGKNDDKNEAPEECDQG